MTEVSNIVVQDVNENLKYENEILNKNIIELKEKHERESSN